MNMKNDNLRSRHFTISDPDKGHEIFTKALNEKDLDVLLDIYADDAVMVSPGGRVHQGQEEMRQFFGDTIKAIDTITLTTVFRMHYKDTVVFRSKYRMVLNTPDGEKTEQATSGIEVMRKQNDGNWLFVADHHYGGADYEEFLELNRPHDQDPSRYRSAVPTSAPTTARSDP